MKKSFRILLLIIALLVMLGITVNAADATATLTSSSTTVKAGDTVEVILAANCEDGISGISTEISYDETKLEKVKMEVLDTSKWTSLGANDNIEVITLSEEKLTDEDIVKITFKVKDGVKKGEKIVVSTSEIILDTDVASDSIKTVESKECTFTVSSNGEPGEITEDPTESKLSGIKIKTPPTKTSYNVGDKFDSSGMVVEATYEDGKTAIVTDYTYSPTSALTATDTKVTITYKEGSTTKTVDQKITVASVTKDGNMDTSKDNTTAKSDITKTGLEKIMIPTIFVILIVTTVGYLQYKKYKNI